MQGVFKQALLAPLVVFSKQPGGDVASRCHISARDMAAPGRAERGVCVCVLAGGEGGGMLVISSARETAMVRKVAQAQQA